MSPTVIAYNEVYNAIQNDVISAGENEAAGVEQMKFYEVAPNLAMPSTRSRPPCAQGDLRSPARGPAAGDPQGRQGSGRLWPPDRSSEDAAKLDAMEKQQGLLKRIPFEGRDEMKARVDPVMAAYAEEIGVAEIYEQINAIQAPRADALGARPGGGLRPLACACARRRPNMVDSPGGRHLWRG